MRISVSRLRENIYRLLDQVLATGEPLEVTRRGKLLRIALVESHPPGGRLSRLVPHPDALACEPDEIIHVDWSHEWRP